jgi:hypothetical protein
MARGASLGGDNGGQMPVPVQMPLEAVVTELSQNAGVGSSIDNGPTRLMCALRTLDCPRALGMTSESGWRKDADHVERHALSTCHTPMQYRCIVTQGSALDDQNQRMDCTPNIQGVSTAQHMRPRVSRLACDRAVVCGVRRRHLALLFAARFLMPLTTSSINRWMDDIGGHWPTPEERRHLRARTPATEWHMDGSSPLGTDHGVLVVQEEQDRILSTHEAASEHGEEARTCLPPVKDDGLHGPAACSDDSPSCPEALKAVWPHARLQADPFQTVKHIWGHRKKLLCSYRRTRKASGEAPQHEACMALATKGWQ